MPRTRTRTTDRASISQETRSRAAKEVLEGKSVRSVAKAYSILPCNANKVPQKAEQVARKKFKWAAKNRIQQLHEGIFNFTGKYLTEYLLAASSFYHGLTSRDVWKLAFQLAKKHDCRIPDSWNEKQCVDLNWLSGFMKRNPILSIRSL